ncbi:MAG: DUF5752 family protein [Candidatus Woesearchaeota archaeon]
MEQNTMFKSRLLLPCSPGKTFYTNKGHVVWSIYELVYNIENMDEYTFRYHVNADNNKNDFADWIRFVLEDKELAMALEGIIEKQKYIEIIRKRIKEAEDFENRNS